MMRSETGYMLHGTKVEFSAWYRALKMMLRGTDWVFSISSWGIPEWVMLTNLKTEFHLNISLSWIEEGGLSPEEVLWIAQHEEPRVAVKWKYLYRGLWDEVGREPSTASLVLSNDDKVLFTKWYNALQKELELEGTVWESVLSEDGTWVVLTYKRRNFELVFTRKSILRNRLTPARVLRQANQWLVETRLNRENLEEIEINPDWMDHINKGMNIGKPRES